MEARYVGGDCLTQLGNAEVVRVEGFAARERGRRLVANERRRDFIGFAEPERQQIRIAHTGVGDFANLRSAQRLDGGAGRRRQNGGTHRWWSQAKGPLYCVDEPHSKTLRNAMAMTLRGVVLIGANLFAIVVCGGLGGITGYSLVHALDLSGIAGALIAAFAAMLVATFA